MVEQEEEVAAQVGQSAERAIPLQFDLELRQLLLIERGVRRGILVMEIDFSFGDELVRIATVSKVVPEMVVNIVKPVVA